MRELTVSEKDAGQRLNKYLMKYLKEAPSSFIYKMLRKKNITLNKVRAQGDEILSAGDQVHLFLSEDTIEKFRGGRSEQIQISSSRPSWARRLYVPFENEDILVVDKPAGVLSQKAKAEDYSINEAVLDRLTEQGVVTEDTLSTFTPSVMNRLDRNTSGLVCYGITHIGSTKLAAALKEKTIDKYYTTIVSGCILRPMQSRAYISKDSERNISTVSAAKSDDAKLIETVFTPVGYSVDRQFTLLSVKLLTGRSHQIRAQLKWLGYPMVGDKKYGVETLNREVASACGVQSQLLHAGKMVFPEGLFTEDALTVCSPLPEAFHKVMKYLSIKETQ